MSRSIVVTALLFKIIVILPFIYFIGSLFYFNDKETHSNKIKRRIIFNPSYEKNFKKVNKRYRQILKARKKKNEKKLDLGESYIAFSYSLLMLVMIWTIMNSCILYYNFRINLDKKVVFHGTVIERSASNLISAVDNYLNYVGDKLLVLSGSKKDYNTAIRDMIRKTQNRDVFQRNVSSWLDINFIDPKGQTLITTNDGFLKEHHTAEDCYPLEEALRKKWRFKIGKIQHLKSEFGDYNALPVAMSIDTDELELIGTFAAKIATARIEDSINKSFNDEDICYALLDRNYDLLSKSSNFGENYSSDYFASDYFKKIIGERGGLKEDRLETSVKINDCVITNYRQSDYPVSILIGYNQKIF